MSNSELMAPVDAAAVSTERLRQRLLQEGVSESALQDCEQIMRSEFAALQNQLMVLKQKQALLLETLRQLEVCTLYVRCSTHSFFSSANWTICLNISLPQAMDLACFAIIFCPSFSVP